MKKDKKTGGTDKRYVSSLEKKVAKLESEVKNLKAGRKQLKEDLQKVGDQQLLLFLKVPAEHIGHALQHTDVEVADMKVEINWPAESVKDMAEGIIGKEGAEPEYLLSDNGSNLRKAAELMDMPHHRDVSSSASILTRRLAS